MTKDMPCQHVLYQSYLCYSSIIKIRLVFVSIYNSQYQQIRFFLGIIPASLLGEQGINGCFAHLCVCRWEFPSPFSHIRVAARFCETLPLAPCEPSEKQKDGAEHQVFF